MITKNQQNKIIGQRLRSVREGAGVTQKRLASTLGVSIQQIYKYEDGRNSIGIYNLMNISQIFNIPISYFLEHEVEVSVSSQSERVLHYFESIRHPYLQEGVIDLINCINTVQNAKEIGTIHE